MAELARAVSPHMVDSWAKFVTKVGAWTALAAYLAYVLVGEIRADTKAANDMLRGQVDVTQSIMQQQGVVIELLRRQTNIMTQDCVNNAANDRNDRNRCFDVLNGADPQ
jgi:hypothetical protein